MCNIYFAHFFTTNKPCCRIRRKVIIKKFQSVAFATELTSCIKPSVLLIVEWIAKMKSCFAKVVWSSFKMTKTNIYDVWNAMRNPLGLKRILPDFIIDLMLDDVEKWVTLTLIIDAYASQCVWMRKVSIVFFSVANFGKLFWGQKLSKYRP